MSEWIELSLPIKPEMAIWPGDPQVLSERVESLAAGDVCNVTKLTLGTHTGTHVDGLNHFIAGAPSVDQMPLELMTGKAKVIEIHHPEQITKAEIEVKGLGKGDRVLFRTANSLKPIDCPFDRTFIHLDEEAARYLVEIGVALIGVDYLSIGGYEGNVVEVHHILLGGGVWCVEGLDMRQLEEGNYEFICLPIRLVDGDGGLARAIARRL